MAMVERDGECAVAIQLHLPQALLSVGSVLLVGSILQFFRLSSVSLWGASAVGDAAFIRT
ncbi:hypothetical protein A9513_007440 [Pseudomonas sp. AU12215]|nr:hypothetical protein A9513_007440 [Pseudomonas sp. AU12215]